MASSAAEVIRGDATLRLPSRGTAQVNPGRLPYVLSSSLVVVAAAASLFSYLFPSLLTGSKVATGNMRGTALAMLVVGLPVLITSMGYAARGSTRGLVLWLGTLAYLLYQAFLFCFAVPLNNLFLVYVAYLSLCVWSLVTLLLDCDLTAFGQRLSPQMPHKRLATIGMTLALLNACAWLAQIVPATFTNRPGTLLQDTGLLTNPVFIQDLAIWLPLLAAASIASWTRKPWGLLIAGAMLAMFVLESIGVATDQWFGSHADPLSPSASMSAVPAFAAVALITALPLVWYCQHLDRKSPEQ